MSYRECVIRITYNLESFVILEICVAHSAENHDRFSWMWIIFNMPCIALHALRAWDPLESFVFIF